MVLPTAPATELPHAKTAPLAGKGSRVSSLDWLRVPAAFFVVLIHTHPFQGAKTPLGNLFEVLVNQGARFAVPLFFIISGYFFGKRLRLGRSVPRAMLQSTRRIVPVLLFWSAVYCLLPTDPASWSLGGWQEAVGGRLAWIVHKPGSFLFLGTKEHLWFLPALLFGLGSFALLFRLGGKRLALLGALVIYLFGLLIGPYAPSPWGIHISFAARNGPFFSTLPVTLGYYLSSDRLRLAPRWAAALAMLGYGLHLGEVYGLWRLYGSSPISHDYVLSTVLFALGAALWALGRPEFGAKSRLTRLGTYTLGVYAAHLLFIEPLKRLGPYVPWTLWQGLYPLLVFALSAALTLVLARSRWTRPFVV